MLPKCWHSLQASPYPCGQNVMFTCDPGLRQSLYRDAERRCFFLQWARARALEQGRLLSFVLLCFKGEDDD